MTGDDWKRFAFDSPRAAKLATVRANGAPPVAPIWPTRIVGHWNVSE